MDGASSILLNQYITAYKSLHPVSTLILIPYEVPLPYLAQDKGGPSKGGFLNNILFSLYLCNEINGMCIPLHPPLC